MLEELAIRGIGVIADTRVTFARGLTVITGETGAGKTMVLTGLGLLLGAKPRPSLVRAGFDAAEAEAVLTSTDPATLEAIAADVGGVLDDDALLVGRTVPAEGRARATVAGRAVPAARLAEIVGERVTVHGQSDQLRLTSAAEQRAALDSVAGAQAELDAYRAAFARWREAAAALDDWEATSARQSQERRMLTAGLAAIDAVQPEPGEDDRLRAAADRLMNVEDLRAAAAEAYGALGDDEAGAVSAVGRAARALENASDHVPEYADWAAQLRDAGAVLADVLTELGVYQDELDADPAELDRIHSRRAQLSTLMQSWGPGLDDVIAWAESARARLAELDAVPTDRAGVEAQVAEARTELDRRAADLRAARERAAARLTSAVDGELAGLAMPGARFAIDVTPTDPAPHGADAIEMTLAPHPGAAPLPVARSASGGELSRIMLALEVSLTGEDVDDLTMVFDEIDAGIGGAAGFEIGARLARLARTHQVIVVTHLAQVAAFADRHLVVRKTVSETDAVTDVHAVAGEEREAELARMLSGDDSPTARRHAASLLERAAVRR